MNPYGATIHDFEQKVAKDNGYDDFIQMLNIKGFMVEDAREIAKQFAKAKVDEAIDILSEWNAFPDSGVVHEILDENLYIN